MEIQQFPGCYAGAVNPHVIGSPLSRRSDGVSINGIGYEESGPRPMYLTRVQISSYKAFADIDVPLRPLTVLIGQNDTGKSSFLRALKILGGDHNFTISDSPGNLEPIRAVVQATLVNGLTVSREAVQNVAGSNLIKPVQLFQLPPAGASMVSSGYADSAGPRALEDEGGGVPGLLDYLLRRERKTFFRFIDQLREHVPGVTDIAIRTPQPDQRELYLVLENGFTMPANQASSGVRLMLFFLALVHHPNRPNLILLEEPENGIHPRRLADVMKLLRSILSGNNQHFIPQVVLSTHSPYLLDSVSLDTDQVLVFRRGENEERTIEPADAERLKNFIGEFMLGEIWFNRGEAGIVSQ
jgi:predicted ATPase